jgi:phage terminase small subunit
MTPRQKKFVSEYAKDLNATQAAVRAGYSEKTAKQIGSRLLTDVDVKKAVEARQAAVAERNDITIDGHIETLAALRDAAKLEKQYSAAINAEVKRGEVAGFYVKRTEDVTGLSREQKRERLLKLLA